MITIEKINTYEYENDLDMIELDNELQELLNNMEDK
tara:strand:+ start:201 stop:308 length:108 start_codon:yes stop_codon:yes gene_type:complete